ncbi:MAG: B12-binding domain-containing radical SAM protein [Anaerolineales bacterium]|nr:B12-binding domain-containing radical SAM protein [Anaerolineales bacterium]
MPKLLFGQSYFLRFDPKLWEGMQPYPPLGTLYAASYLREQGYEVALFDAMLAESEADWAVALEREKPDFAILYEDNFNYLSKMCLSRMREAAFTMTKMAKDHGLTIIICGSDATDHYPNYLEKGADFILLGEGEATLAELLACLTGRSETRLEEILGLAFREGKEEETENSLLCASSLAPTTPDTPVHFHTTPRRADLRDLDALPFPAWDLIDVEKYRSIWLTRHGYYSMNMVTTRGCPFHCNWCAKPIWGQRYHSRSPENVVAEMKWLKETYHPDHIWFADDILGLKPGWLVRFAETVDRKKARIPFKGLSRVDLLLREGEVDALHRAGADIIWVGAESGAQKILTAMEKGTKVEQIYEAARRMHAAGVKIAFFLQFGYPGETRADIEKTLQMVRDLMPDDIGMSVSYPLPGTKFYDRVQDQLGDKQNWVDSADLEMMYQGPFTTEFYRHLHTTLHKEYRARKTWRVLKRLVRHPEEFRPAHVRQAAAMVFHSITLPLARQKLKTLEQVPHKGMELPKGGMTLEESAIPTKQD